MYSYNFDQYRILKTNINHETHFKIHFDVTAQVDFNSKPTSIIKPTSIMKHTSKYISMSLHVGRFQLKTNINHETQS